MTCGISVPINSPEGMALMTSGVPLSDYYWRYLRPVRVFTSLLTTGHVHTCTILTAQYKDYNLTRLTIRPESSYCRLGFSLVHRKGVGRGVEATFIWQDLLVSGWSRLLSVNWWERSHISCQHPPGWHNCKWLVILVAAFPNDTDLFLWPYSYALQEVGIQY